MAHHLFNKPVKVPKDDRRVTREEFALFLINTEGNCYYYTASKTIYCMITPQGQVRYWANWGYGDTPLYASLEKLLDCDSDLPMMSELQASTHGPFHPNPTKEQCDYVADYIQEERRRRRTIDSQTIRNAFDAFEGGAR